MTAPVTATVNPTVNPTELPTRVLRWWDLACTALLIFVVVMVLIDARNDTPEWSAGLPLAARSTIVVAPAGFIALLYALLGRRALVAGMQDHPVTPQVATFLVLLLLALAAGAMCNPMYAMVQALVYPLVWTIAMRWRDAVLWCVAIAANVSVGLYLGLVPADPVAALYTSAVTGSMSLVFSVAMGTWISRIHAQGERYRAVADELRRSQDQVAALSAAAGASRERERMSRDLHDTLTQTLTGLVMLSEQAGRALNSGQLVQAGERIDRVGAAARSAVGEARALIATTQPIGDDGLARTIERVAAGIRADTGLRVDVEVSVDPAVEVAPAVEGDLSAHSGRTADIVHAVTVPVLSREREVVLLRAVQEGLANVRKHARASGVSVTVSAQPDGRTLLRIDDDGVGPQQASPERSVTHADSGGYGLAGLTDRVRAVGGELRFGPRPGGGSRLDIQLTATRETPPHGGARPPEGPPA